MSNSDAVLLRHIIMAIEQVERYTRGMSESEFLSRSMVQDATVRQIEIISTAASNISLEFQNAHPKLAWSKMIGL
ncbi:MAG TPA: HepT-like ribonuclease domain-containing protein, partial [Anaerolineales bacterium]|nr:HepT-like ribonuclease domain-containing protein [Anaerolineales bacterium]